MSKIARKPQKKKKVGRKRGWDPHRLCSSEEINLANTLTIDF